MYLAMSDEDHLYGNYMNELEDEFDEIRLNTEELVLQQCSKQELERFLEFHYPNNREMIAKVLEDNGTWQSDSCYDAELCCLLTITKGKINSEDFELLSSFKENKASCALNIILNDLCNKDHIDPGLYLICVD